MTAIQEKILETLNAMGDKSKFTDAILSKKLREIAKIDGKKKAAISLADLMAATEELSKSGIFYSITVTSANDLIIEKSDAPKELPLENKQRRQKHEKSMDLFTSGDLQSKEKSGGKQKPKASKSKRTERKSINIYEKFDDE